MWWLLIGIDIGLVLAHIFAKNWIGFFDLDKEGNFASLFMGVQLWTAATCAILIAFIHKKRSQPRRHIIPWLLFAVGIAYIGLDDMMGIHERIGFVLNNLFGTGGFYGESFNWLFYFSPFAIAACFIMGYITKELFTIHKSSAYFLLAGVGVWLFALGAEIYGRTLILSPVVPVARYHMLIIVEEFAELAGASLLLIGCMRYVHILCVRHIVIAHTDEIIPAAPTKNDDVS